MVDKDYNTYYIIDNESQYALQSSLKSGGKSMRGLEVAITCWKVIVSLLWTNINE